MRPISLLPPIVILRRAQVVTLSPRRDLHTFPTCRQEAKAQVRHFDVYQPYRIKSASGHLSPLGHPASGEAFKTASTVPAGTSFQDVPPPPSVGQVSTPMTVQQPVPAMKAETTLETSEPLGKELVVDGVHVPPKPRRPGEEECCMSGCAYCVYDIYAEELETYTGAVKDARAKLETKGVPTSQWPEDLRPKTKGKDPTGKILQEESLEEALDPSMAAFLALEKKIKKKQAPESSGAAE